VNLSPGEFDQLRDLVHRLCGLALADEKEYLVRHRLTPVARSAGCATFAAFLEKLKGPAGPALREPIIEAVTTRETAFFRDRHPFDAFRHVLLPRLAAARRRAGRPPVPVRVWSAGVATGQEAYSLAMMVDDFLRSPDGADLKPRDFAVIATDISPQALAAARAGRYTDPEVLRGVSPAWRARYFHQDGAGWKIDARLRHLIEFRQVNLMDHFGGLGPVDVIFCRNVLIYFDEAARRRLCDRFAEMLAPDGWLVLGAVENLYGITSRFASEHVGPTVVYRKT
jgi:chemotaxis protein methyltransferase CheR